VADSEYTEIAQLVERRSPKPQVAGSIPAFRANKAQARILFQRAKARFLVAFALCFEKRFFSFNKKQGLKMGNLTAYIRESFDELTQKMTWPTWQNLQETTGVVLVGTALLAVVIFVMDFASNQILHLIYK
jgi:preprotein translocase subunit SecE